MLAPMATQEPTAAPDPFVRLLRSSIASQGVSLREIGRRIGASTAYMSRLVNKQRGLPTDKTITKMEKALNIEQGALFAAAGRHDAIAAKVFKNDKTRQLIRSLEPLTDEQFNNVVKKALEMAKKYHPEEP
jgi:transcriptional regulator with XRE-family HTH domain